MARGGTPASWKPGQSGNPHGGRPSNARRIVSDAFVRSMARAWKDRGDEVIRRVIDEEPATFLRVIASLVPKDMTLSGDEGGIVINIVKHTEIGEVAEEVPPGLGWKPTSKDVLNN